MALHIEFLEAVWLVVNVTALVITGMALVESVRDLAAARSDTEVRHEARELTAYGNVRRESLRIIVQTLLLSLVIPGLFSDQPIPLTPFVLTLIAIPVVLLLSTVLDARERTKLSTILLDDIRAERVLLALESSVQENIKLTREAGSQAKAAYHEANSVNEKIAALGVIVTHKEDKLGEAPADLSGEAVIEEDAQAMAEVPDPSGDVGAAVDHWSLNGTPVPTEEDQGPAR